MALFLAQNFLNDWGFWTALGVLAGVLPVLSLFSAARAVPGKSPLVTGSVAAAVVGVTLSVWGLVMLSGQAADAWWLSGAAGLAAVVAAVPRWRRALPVVPFLAMGCGVLLGVWAGQSGVAPGIAVWLAVLSVAGTTLASDGVSRRAAVGRRRWDPGGSGLYW
ncbi:hypothetical protein EDD27_2111 [Nonomuraea polychroma]|uniref:Uncharacterized protein n=1 Tax=Nonomuraea polychroma TaxID=46176 RepID=A0A438M2I2_9ACTN|nr:hypothetical protein EDD27_2111 [Nonomuraea polychroma]